MKYYSYECNWCNENYDEYFSKGIVCAGSYTEAMGKISEAYENITEVRISYETDEPVYEIND